MKTLLKWAALGGLVAYAFSLYRERQRYDVKLPGTRSKPQGLVADTNSVVTGDAAQKQNEPQPQDWRGAQNVLE